MSKEQTSIDISASTRKVNARAFINGLDLSLLKHLARDLIELDFQLGENHWPRWSCVAFVNGLRLAHCEPNLAAQLLTPAPQPLLAEGEEILVRLKNIVLCSEDLELVELRRVFGELAQNPPLFVGQALHGLSPSSQLSRWFVAATLWGLSAGLKRNHLYAGHLLGYAERLPLGQHFIGNRLVILARCSRRRRRPALVDLIAYSYRRRSCERKIVAAAAHKVLRQLKRDGTFLDPGAWVLSSFRDGLMMSVQKAEMRDRLLSELTPQERAGLGGLFARRIGPDPSGWTSERLVGAAMGWLAATHPHVAAPSLRADEFERIRHLFDFAFWMGIAAGRTVR